MLTDSGRTRSATKWVWSQMAAAAVRASLIRLHAAWMYGDSSLDLPMAQGKP
ncbi:hypothetical protein RchiOBHm_Chr4g0434921 [Rosa chinensis]|uniref:Uncharacterized protein n=1 Tax=Rosa chinensis TaxID=74649 RepID=A0A2P6R1P3_ROSCH|nr:hypothetical protein RchiOBHm_Chr4g0434921 [Rosa chinensis]